MKLNVIVQPKTVDGIFEAARWYDNNFKGLGESIIDSIDSAIYSFQ